MCIPDSGYKKSKLSIGLFLKASFCYGCLGYFTDSDSDVIGGQ